MEFELTLVYHDKASDSYDFGTRGYVLASSFHWYQRSTSSPWVDVRMTFWWRQSLKKCILQICTENILIFKFSPKIHFDGFLLTMKRNTYFNNFNLHRKFQVHSINVFRLRAKTNIDSLLYLCPIWWQETRLKSQVSFYWTGFKSSVLSLVTTFLKHNGFLAATKLLTRKKQQQKQTKKQ